MPELDVHKAKEMAENYLKAHFGSPVQNPPVILDTETLEFSLGWVFFYQGKIFVESGDILGLYVGNAPIIVNRNSGAVEKTGTAFQIEHYLKEYEQRHNGSST